MNQVSIAKKQPPYKYSVVGSLTNQNKERQSTASDISAISRTHFELAKT